jgi:hypothetical protein
MLWFKFPFDSGTNKVKGIYPAQLLGEGRRVLAAIACACLLSRRLLMARCPVQKHS